MSIMSKLFGSGWAFLPCFGFVGSRVWAIVLPVVIWECVAGMSMGIHNHKY